MGNGSGIPFLHNRIWSIHIDLAQNVWMRMYDGRVFVLNRYTDTIINPFEDITGYENFKTNRPLTITSSGKALAIIDGVGIYVMSLNKQNLTHDLINTGTLKVRSIVEGYQNDMWVGTDQGIHRMNITNGTIEKDGYFLDEQINCTYSNGYYVYAGTNSGKIVTFAYGQEPKVIATFDTPVNSLFVDSHDIIWFSRDAQGVSRLIPGTGNIKSFTQRVLAPQYDETAAVMKEVGGVLWIAMNRGGFGYYDRESDEVKYFHNDPDNPWNLSNSVNAFVPLTEGVVFESTSQHGLEKLEILKKTIDRIQLFNDDSGSNINEVRALYYDRKRQQLLIGNKTSTLVIIKNGSRTDYHGDTHPFGRIYGISQDRYGNYWISSKGNGVTIMKPTASGYQFTQYQHEDGNDASLSDNNAYCSIEDKDGNIWVATYGGGINIFVRQSNGSYKILNRYNGLSTYPKDAYKKVRTLALDHEGQVWAGTTDGLLIMSYKNKKFSVEEVAHTKQLEYALSSNDVVCLACDAEGSMWIGTNGGGLNHTLERDEEGCWKFEHFGAQEGLPSDEIRSISFDARGYVWFATDHLLCSLNTSTHIFSIFTIQDGVDNTLCSESAALVLPNGNILFGTLNGYYEINHQKLGNAAGTILKLKITDFFINDEIITPRTNKEMPYYIPDSRTVLLPSHDSEFAFRFASLNFQLQHRVHYQYKLEGYDKEWHNADKTRTATYSELPAGTYKFKVKAFLLESPDNYDLREIEVKVPPYWLFSPVAVWIYMVMLAVLVLALIYFHQEKLARKERLRVIKVGHQEVAFQQKGDYEFMKKQLEWLEEHYSDTNMKIEDLISQSTMGRAMFYNQLQALTGLSPKQFVTDFRLKKAVSFLDNDNDVTISEVAERCGFGDPVYFTQSFKTKYGVTPAKYRDAHQQEVAAESTDNPTGNNEKTDDYEIIEDC